MAITSSAARNAKPPEHIGLYVWVSFLGLIAIGLSAFVLKFPYFRYVRVDVAGETAVSRADLISDLRAYPLRGAVGRLLGYDHFFLWGASPVALPELTLAEVVVSRDFLRRTLRVTATDRARALVWCDEHGACVWVDDGGIAFERAPFAEGQLVTQVIERGHTLPALGSSVLLDTEFSRLTRAIRVAQSAEVPLRDITLVREAKEARIALQGGPTLIFSLRIDPEFAATALAALASRKDFRDIAEVDFTVERKAYYKMKN